MTVCLSLIIPINHLTILSFIAIAGGLYFFLSGFRLLARKRLLQSTPMSRIHSAALGLVEVNGKAVGPHTMPAPITGQPCFLYRTTAWQQCENKEQEWDKVADETLHLPFFIEDSTGQLLIEPLGADLDLLRDFREEYASSFLSNSMDLPPRVGDFLLRHAVVPTRHIRIEEHLIKPDDPLFIAGSVTENPGIQVRQFAPRTNVDANHNEVPTQKPRQDNPHDPAALDTPDRVGTPQVIRLASVPAASSSQQMGQQAKIAAALTRAGITQPEAWAAAGVPYQTAIVEESTNQRRTDPSDAYFSDVRIRQGEHPEQFASSRFCLTPPVVLMKGENNPLFVISYRSQKEFVSKLKWKSAVKVWGGAAITLLGIYVVLAQMALL